MEDSLHLYENFMRLPLFSGLGSEEMTQIIAQTKFQFLRLEAGDYFCRQDEKTDQLVILNNGKMIMTTQSDDYGCMVEENITAPYVLSPETLFGLYQRYLHSYICDSACTFVILSKAEVFKLFDNYFIFRINWLNLIATKVQKRSMQIWHTPPASLRQRIIRFFVQHSDKPAGKKVFHIKMERLARDVNESRLKVSQQLHSLKEDGFITMKRGLITVNALEKLIQKKENL